MDTDGYVDTLCDITTIDYPLARQYAELIASLGHRPTITTKTAMLYGKACSLRHEVTFTPSETVFRLCRAARLRQVAPVLNRGRAIVDVVPCESVPVRCVEVGSVAGHSGHPLTFPPTTARWAASASSSMRPPGSRPRLHRDPHAGDHQRPASRSSSARQADRPAVVPDARPARRATYGHPDLGSHYHGQVAATESRYEEGRREPDDDGPAISYKVLARGTRVGTADEVELGTVEEVLDNVKENIRRHRRQDSERPALRTPRRLTGSRSAWSRSRSARRKPAPPHDPKGGGGEFRANPKSRFRPWRRTSR
jgi:hypothetical protein